MQKIPNDINLPTKYLCVNLKVIETFISFVQATLLAPVYHAVLLTELIFSNKNQAMSYRCGIQATLDNVFRARHAYAPERCTHQVLKNCSEFLLKAVNPALCMQAVNQILHPHRL